MATEPEGQELPDAQQDIRNKGNEFLFGYDVPRQWVTGAQVFTTGEIATIVFREQTLLQNEEGVEGIVRNIVSVVMPTHVLRDMHTIIGRELERVGGENSN